MKGYLHRTVRDQPREYAQTIERSGRGYGIVWTRNPDAVKVIDDSEAYTALNWINNQIAKQQYLDGLYGFSSLRQ